MAIVAVGSTHVYACRLCVMTTAFGPIPVDVSCASTSPLAVHTPRAVPGVVGLPRWSPTRLGTTTFGAAQEMTSTTAVRVSFDATTLAAVTSTVLVREPVVLYVV